MKFNLAEPKEAGDAFAYLGELVSKRAIAEVVKVSPRRSLRQNNYLHLLLGAFGAHFGYTIAESKLLYKEMNRDLYEYDKKGRIFFRSSADLDTAEMTKSIDRFRTISAEAGYPLPLATDDEWLRSIENTLERNERYL